MVRTLGNVEVVSHRLNSSVIEWSDDKGAVASIVVFFYYICRKKRQI